MFNWPHVLSQFLLYHRQGFYFFFFCQMFQLKHKMVLDIWFFLYFEDVVFVVTISRRFSFSTPARWSRFATSPMLGRSASRVSFSHSHSNYYKLNNFKLTHAFPNMIHFIVYDLDQWTVGSMHGVARCFGFYFSVFGYGAEIFLFVFIQLSHSHIPSFIDLPWCPRYLTLGAL